MIQFERFYLPIVDPTYPMRGGADELRRLLPMAHTPTFFSRTAGFLIGALLLIVVLWAVFMLGPTAIDRWFR